MKKLTKKTTENTVSAYGLWGQISKIFKNCKCGKGTCIDQGSPSTSTQGQNTANYNSTKYS